MLAARRIRVELGGRCVVDGVDLEVAPGRVVVVAGPNGAGKSTVLRALAGEIRPSAGSVSMNGDDLRSRPARETARLRAVLRQRTTVSFPMTAREVALLGRIPHNGGVETARDREAVRESLRRTGVDHLAARPYASLSGGEQQRVQLARVLAQIVEASVEPSSGPSTDAYVEPRYLLLDEPTAGLDLAHQHLCLRIARRLARQGVGVLAVLHDLTLAARYADDVVLLRAGRLVAAGPAHDALTPQNVADVFGMRAHSSLHPKSGRLRLSLGAPLRRPASTETRR